MEDPTSTGSGSISRRSSYLPVPQAQQERLTCPVLTLQNKSVEELTNREIPDIRAYKLGKKRWSYNQFELKVHNEAGDNSLDVKEALQSTTPQPLQRVKDSSASYKVRLTNSFYIVVHVFIVYETAIEVRVSDSKHGPQNFYQWICVDRSACKKGCQGPCLRPIQRFGRVGKRSGPDAPKNQAGQLKNYKYMYLSLDEAGTHVGGSRFRLLFAVYDTTGTTLLGTTVSTPIKVLANNDVPTGAAHVTVDVTLRSDWVGWYNVCPMTLKPLPPASPSDGTYDKSSQQRVRQRTSSRKQYLTDGKGADEEDYVVHGHTAASGSLDNSASLDDVLHERDLSRNLSRQFPATGQKDASPDVGPDILPPCISPGDSSYSSLTNNCYPQDAVGSLQHLLASHVGHKGGELELQELLRNLNAGVPADLDINNNQGFRSLLSNGGGIMGNNRMKRLKLEAGPSLQHFGLQFGADGEHHHKEPLMNEVELTQMIADYSAILGEDGGATPVGLANTFNFMPEDLWNTAGMNVAKPGQSSDVPVQVARLHELAADLNVDLGIDVHDLCDDVLPALAAPVSPSHADALASILSRQQSLPTDPSCGGQLPAGPYARVWQTSAQI